MRTKHLLTAMALPLAFAACSQEEIITESPVLESRKVVGEVTLSMNELDSRMALMGGKYTWETGDKFGACLMDELVGGKYDTDNIWFNDFRLVDYIQTNYPFTRLENGLWKAEAVMCEGNYFFYFPYNSNGGGLRSAIKLDIPTEQVADLYNPASALNDQLFVGYQAIKADEKNTSTSVDVTMEPLLAFPKFNLKNVGTEDLEVYKITYASYQSTSKTAAIVPGTFSTYYELKPATANFNNSGFAGLTAANQRKAVVSTAVLGEENKVDQISVSFDEATLAANGGTLSAYMLMPPTPTTISYPKLYIYTSAGLGIVDLSQPNTDPKTGKVTNITNDRKLTTVGYNDGAQVNITFDNTALDQPFAMSVRSTDELEYLVEWNQKNTGDEPLVATLVNDEVALTKKVYDMLVANKNIKLRIKTDGHAHSLNIPADAPKDILSYIDNIDAAYGAYDKVQLKIAEGADVVLPKNLNKGIVVENYGTIELANSEYFHIYNSGKVVITGAQVYPYNVTITGLLENYGEVVNNTDITIHSMQNVGEFTNNGNYGSTVLFENLNGYELTGESYIEQVGKFVNNGSLTIDSDGNNAGIFTNTAMIENNGEIKCVSKNSLNNTVSPHYNYPYNTRWYDVRIINNGVMNGVNNSGLVTMGAKDARYISNAASTGEVNNNVQSPYVNKGTAEDITLDITAENNASDVATAVEASNATILYLSGTLTIDPAEGKTSVDLFGQLDNFSIIANDNLVINGKGTLKVRSSKGNKRATDFIVNANKTVKVKQGAHIDATNTNVTANGKLLIEAGASFKATVKAGSANIEDYSKTLVK